MMMGNGSGLELASFINTAMDRNGGSGNGWDNGGGGFLWLLVILLIAGRGWGGFGGGNGGAEGGAAQGVEAAVARARADGLSDQVVIDAISGNQTAISQLASTLHCDVAAIQNAICGIDKSILQVANQIGTSSMQIINAVQAGNCEISRAIADCCCKTQQLVTQMSYENRIQNMEQTNALTGTINAGFSLLGNKIDSQTQTMLNGFQGLRDYLTGEKIESLQHQVTQLENNANNSAQTLALRAAIDAATAPIQNRVDTLVSRSTPNPIPTYPAPQFTTGYTYGIIPTNNCFRGFVNNCSCNSCGCNNGCGCNNNTFA